MDSVSLTELVQRAKERRLGALPVPAAAFIASELLSRWTGGRGDVGPEHVRLNIFGEVSCAPGGDFESVSRLLYLMITGETFSDVSPKVINPQLPDAIVAVTLAAYPSAEVMRQPLQRYLAEKAPGYAHDNVRELVLDLFPELELRAPAPRSSNGLVIGLSAALLVVGMVLAALLMRASVPTLAACLDARVEPLRPPELKQVQQEVGNCLRRPLTEQDVLAVEQYVCGVQQRAIARAKDPSQLDFIPVACAGQVGHRADVQRAIAAARANLMERTQDGYVAAKGQLEECVKLDPSSSECHRLLGDTFKELSDLKRSAEEYQRFLQTAPQGDPAIAGVKTILESMHQMATP